jgi:hypothetical protein
MERRYVPRSAMSSAGGRRHKGDAADQQAARAGPCRRVLPMIRGRQEMATFAFIHGGGDVGWYWHLVEAQLRARSHEVVAPDLPCDDDSADLRDYVDTVVDAIGDRGELVVVGQSYGAFTAPLVADRLQAQALVLVAGMIPAPGEAAADWWDNTGYRQAVEEQARRDRGMTGSDDSVRRLLPRRPPRSRGGGAEQGTLRVARRVPQPLAPRGLAGRANTVRTVHRGSLLPGRLHAQGGFPAPWRHSRRDRRRALRRAQPPEGAGGPARRLCRRRARV